MTTLSQSRTEIARKVRDLRQHRRWTQAQLAAELDLSQSRLSEIERGQGSFSAEQFLRVLQLFNTPVDHFATESASADVVLQDAVARLGAAQLRESTEALPSERLKDVEQVIREVLISADSARLVTALAPVLVANANHVNLRKLAHELQAIGLAHRLGWLLENTLQAIRQELPRATGRAQQSRYRRAEIILGAALESLRPSAPAGGADILDPDIRSQKSRLAAEAAASEASKRWAIVTRIEPEDFAHALRASHVGD